MWDRMRDMRHGHRKDADIAGEVYQLVCVGKELWGLWKNDLKKKMNVCDGYNAEGGGGQGGRVHAREKVSASYKG